MPDRSRVYRTHALVIRRRDHADADRILTLFTPTRGRVEVIAKGVRKTTSRKAGHLEPFTHTNLLLAEGRTWDIVTEVVTIESFRHLRADLAAISFAAYVVELLDTFAETDDDHRPLWELALLALRAYDQRAAGEADFDRNVLLAWYVLHLLSATGFEPQLFQCLACGDDLQPVSNYFSMNEGGVCCPRCGNGRQGGEIIDADLLKILRYLQSRTWEQVNRLHVPTPLRRRVDSLLHRYLLSVMERNMRSVDFLRRMQNDPIFNDDVAP
ncbi:MAG: DNA repair protein RecO [Caldilineaceae bacterium]